MASDDDSWTLVGARKPGPKRSVLYIGNLNAECTEEKLMAFVEGRAKTIGNAASKVFNAINPSDQQAMYLAVVGGH